jgi:Domain of unknown function (DUF4188)
MNSRVERKTVDLSPFPDLVVIYLGMRVNALTGFKTLFGFGPQIKKSVDQKPDGLLLHENFIMSLIPLHLGMRQYWRDFGESARPRCAANLARSRRRGDRMNVSQCVN